jgi:hypothetical protein
MPGNTAAEVLLRAGVAPARLQPIMPRVDAAAVPVRIAPPSMRALWARGIKAMTLPWAIYVDPAVWERFEDGSDPERDGRLMVHELMHVEQVRRAGAVRHSIRYLADYLQGRAAGLGHWDAYRAIPAEQEARAASRLVMDHT